jgi:hypothetical protein
VVAHGRGGWVLEDYDWDPVTGIAKLTYERVRVDTGEPQVKVLMKAQPASSAHAGWNAAVAAMQF